MNHQLQETIDIHGLLELGGEDFMTLGAGEVIAVIEVEDGLLVTPLVGDTTHLGEVIAIVPGHDEAETLWFYDAAALEAAVARYVRNGGLATLRADIAACRNPELEACQAVTA